jgi:hypothetical protein
MKLKEFKTALKENALFIFSTFIHILPLFLGEFQKYDPASPLDLQAFSSFS